MSPAARFAAVLGTLHAAHDVADHVVQTDAQALGKTTSWRAMAGHVGSYHAVQVAALAAADRLLGLGLSPRRTAAAVALSAASHAFLDRRWPVRRVLELTASPGFASGTHRPPVAPLITALTEVLRLARGEHLGPLTPVPHDLPADWPVPLHGPYLADQALHHACLWLAALIACGGTR